MARLRSYDYESETVGLWKHHEHDIILSFIDVLSEFVETHEVIATLSRGEFNFVNRNINFHLVSRSFS